MNKNLLLSIIKGAGLSLISFPTLIQAQQKPNIIVILADDLGYGDMSAYGSKTIDTPNFDHLANGGVMFTNGYATSATSTPSRYALMTGVYPWKNEKAKILPGDAPLLIDPSQPTLPKMMQSAGYKTGAVGKWHLGMGKGNPNWNRQISPCANDIGFDYSCLIAATNDRVPTVYVENGNVVGLEDNDPIYVDYKKNFDGEPTALTNPEMLKMEWAHGHNQSITNGIPRIGYMKGGKNALWVDEQMADYFVSKVKTFIGDNKDTPFFLYYGLHQPHVPRLPNPQFEGKSGMGPRGDVILEADWCVGELIKELEKLNILENTIIIFTSDNGPVLNDGYKDNAVEQLGEHKPSGSLRGGKYSLYDAGTHIPFVVYWKGKIAPIKSNALICQIDLMASFAQMLKMELPAKLDSQNLIQTILGKDKKGRKDLVIEANGRLAYRMNNYVMIPPYKGDAKNLTGNELGNLSEFGLFDLNKDIHQDNNIASEKPNVLSKMKSAFMAITEGYYKTDVAEIKLE